jgi:hypothetical protein
MGLRDEDTDRTDLLLLEHIVRRFKTIETVALSRESGICPERISTLFVNHFCSVSRTSDPGPNGEVWTYTTTVAEKAAERETNEQEDRLERQRCNVRVPPF